MGRNTQNNNYNKSFNKNVSIIDKGKNVSRKPIKMLTIFKIYHDKIYINQIYNVLFYSKLGYNMRLICQIATHLADVMFILFAYKVPLIIDSNLNIFHCVCIQSQSQHVFFCLMRDHTM